MFPDVLVIFTFGLSMAQLLNPLGGTPNKESVPLNNQLWYGHHKVNQQTATPLKYMYGHFTHQMNSYFVQPVLRLIQF